MVARTWHGRVPAAQTDNYYAYLQRTGLADYQATPGNLGILVQTWTEADVSHFLITTLWESLDAIRRFAGEPVDVARYYPEDDDFLLEREPHVTHSTVLMAAMPSAVR
jgi:heme-degrading monooxygenase HmoA